MSVSPAEKTLVFFDLFEHPLTGPELWRWLWREQLSLPELLENIKKIPTIEAGGGFYFLSSRTGLPLTRGRRQIWNDAKMRQAQRAAQWIKWLPFVRLVAVCNTVNLGVAQEGSDIDFFIIVRAGRLWLTRFLVSVVLRLARLRTYGQRTKDRVCLSFFLSDDSLDISALVLSEEAGEPDVYLIYWLTQLAPLINREQTLEKFWQANGWVSKYLPNFFVGTDAGRGTGVSFFAGVEEGAGTSFFLPNSDGGAGVSFFAAETWGAQRPLGKKKDIPAPLIDLAESRQEIGEGRLTNGIRIFLENIFSGWLGNKLEKFFFQWQEQRLRERLASKLGGGGVVLSPNIIKLHENDRRALYRTRWLEKIKQYENGKVGG